MAAPIGVSKPSPALTNPFGFCGDGSDGWHTARPKSQELNGTPVHSTQSVICRTLRPSWSMFYHMSEIRAGANRLTDRKGIWHLAGHS